MAYATFNKPSLHFNTKLYTGNGGTQSITGVGFQPDWCWIKNREQTLNHVSIDAVRGLKYLYINSTSAEGDYSSSFTSFDSDGFSVGATNNVNQSSNGIAAWNWKANGAGSANTDGSINTTATSVNTAAGFSIVSWTGNGNTATIGHGLGVAPKMIIFKSRDNSHAWFVGHEGLDASAPWTKYMTLDTTDAVNDDVIWNDTAPTNQVFSVGSYSSTNGNGVKFIAYCFAEKKGYSKIGKYTGNGNADGPFIYTGFKPAFFFMKETTDSSTNWIMYDNKRSTFNAVDDYLKPNSGGAESTGLDFDFTSNGIKCRNNNAGINASGQNYIYMAIAEEPLVANVGVGGIPATAR